jgi:hypothetical protein
MRKAFRWRLTPDWAAAIQLSLWRAAARLHLLPCCSTPRLQMLRHSQGGAAATGCLQGPVALARPGLGPAKHNNSALGEALRAAGTEMRRCNPLGVELHSETSSA